MRRTRLKVGDVVLVTSATDDTLPATYIGRIGRICAKPRYEGVGDDPLSDPFWLVQHTQGFGIPATTQHYWTEEVERL